MCDTDKQANHHMFKPLNLQEIETIQWTGWNFWLLFKKSIKASSLKKKKASSLLVELVKLGMCELQRIWEDTKKNSLETDNN